MTQKPNRMPGTLERLRAAAPLLPPNYPLPDGHALRAFVRAAPALDPQALSDALGDAVPLPPPANRRRSPNRAQRRINASEQARHILATSLRDIPAPLRQALTVATGLLPPGFLPAFPRDLNDVAGEFAVFARRNGIAPETSPFHKALANLRAALRDYSPQFRNTGPELEKLHTESLAADLISHAAEARNQPVNDPFCRMLLEHATPFLRPGASESAPSLPEPPRNIMLAATWTAPIHPGRDDGEQRSRRFADAVAMHCERLESPDAHLVIPVLHGFARIDDDADPVFSHPSLHVASHLERHGIPFATLPATIDIQGQACVPGMHDPANDSKPAVLLITAPDPFPDEDIRTMRSEAETATSLIPPAWSVVSDDLVTAAAIGISASATILRSDADMGKDFLSHNNAATNRLARPQIDQPIRNAIACAAAAYGEEFPLRIETSATVCDCLDRETGDMPRAIAAIRTATPEAPATSTRRTARPPFRIALHTAFPNLTQQDRDTAEQLRSDTVAQVTEALTLAAVTFRKTFFALRQQDPDLAARIPDRVSVRYMAGSDLDIAPALRSAIHNARTPKPGQISIGHFEPLADSALPDPDTHLVLAHPRDLPLQSRNAIAAACHAAARDNRRKPVILLREPCSQLILYGNPATRSPADCPMPRTPRWSRATAHPDNADLIASTPSHGALRLSQHRTLTDPATLSRTLVQAAFAAADLPAAAYSAAGLQPAAALPSATPTAAAEDSAQLAKPRLHPTDPLQPPYWPEPRTAMEHALQSSSRMQHAA